MSIYALESAILNKVYYVGVVVRYFIFSGGTFSFRNSLSSTPPGLLPLILGSVSKFVENHICYEF